MSKFTFIGDDVVTAECFKKAKEYDCFKGLPGTMVVKILREIILANNQSNKDILDWYYCA